MFDEKCLNWNFRLCVDMNNGYGHRVVVIFEMFFKPIKMWIFNKFHYFCMQKSTRDLGCVFHNRLAYAPDLSHCSIILLVSIVVAALCLDCLRIARATYYLMHGKHIAWTVIQFLVWEGFWNWLTHRFSSFLFFFFILRKVLHSLTIREDVRKGLITYM